MLLQAVFEETMHMIVSVKGMKKRPRWPLFHHAKALKVER